MSVTSPWDAQAATAVQGAVRRVYTVQANHSSWGSPITLDAVACSVVHDEAWSPFVQATVRIAIPSDATLDLLDPRLGVRLIVSVGFIYPGGQEDVQEFADLVLVDRATTRPDNVVELTATSDETLVQRWAPIFYDSTDTELFFATGEGIAATIGALVTLATGESLTVSPSVGLDVLAQDETVQEGESPWSLMTELADRLNAWLYHDGLGTWRLDPRPEIAGKSVAQLTTGPLGTIVESSAALSTDVWGNAVVLEYRTDTGTTQRSYAIATAGDFSIASAPRTVRKVTRTTPPTAAAAESVLKRVITRGRSWQVTALDAPWVLPGLTVTVQLPTGDQERHLVQRTARNLDAGLMTVTTRQPFDVTIQSGE